VFEAVKTRFGRGEPPIGGRQRRWLGELMVGLQARQAALVRCGKVRKEGNLAQCDAGGHMSMSPMATKALAD
jgi:hypothetical protein